LRKLLALVVAILQLTEKGVIQVKMSSRYMMVMQQWWSVFHLHKMAAHLFQCSTVELLEKQILMAHN
jgi:hypothetical protein